MKNIVVITALFALSFATGFTCSKNAPEQAAQTTEAPPAPAPDQATMAASTDASEAPAPAPADSTAPAAPTETK